MNHNIKLFNPFDWSPGIFDDQFFGNKNLSLFGSNQKIMHFPKVNISEDDESVIVTANVPGIAPKDISINVDENVLTLSGHTKREEEEGKKDSDFYRFEREEGSFMRTISLPSHINKGSVDAKTKNGVLTVTMKKLASGDNQKIHIREE